MITISAPGKIHLSGEHSVVYGQPALLVSVEKRIRIFGKLLTQKKILFYDTQTNKKQIWDYSEIQRFTNWANEQWELFAQSGDTKFLACIKKDIWGLPKIAIGHAYQFLKKEPKTGLYLELSSELQPGVGMGSSAALAAALVGTLFCLENQAWDLEKINQVVYEIEKKVHGFPSGGDNTAVVYGGVLRFQNKDNKKSIKRLAISKNLPEFILIDSGRAEESTAEMVEKLKTNYAHEKSKLQKIVTQVGKVTEHMVTCLQKGQLKDLGSMITKNQNYLEALSLVGQKAKQIVQLIESVGGSAKICGAGGIEKGSGVILALHPELPKLTDLLTKQNIPFFNVALSKEGIIREKV